MSKLIVFTGGCYSGKTTSMKCVEKILTENGYKVKNFSEIIRSHNFGSIDDIRKDGNKYLEVQDIIVREKMNGEIELKNSNEYDYVLVDRAVTDSLFYLTFYTNKSDLSKESVEVFAKLYNDLTKHIENSEKKIYDYIFEFCPLNNNTNDDKFRPASLDTMKWIEYGLIKTYNELYYGQNKKYMKFDLNDVKLEGMENYWKFILFTIDPNMTRNMSKTQKTL